ncbi:MAG TPA: hypothetical protein GXX19_09525 [Syntrophomonadaceae bacterium]|nr:hypothetical protein [Syntrophomonadaceae bacterium]
MVRSLKRSQERIREMAGIDNVTELPHIASPNIDEVLQEFLRDQEARLSHSTLKRYKRIIDYFTDCMNEYGHLYLSRAELCLFERLNQVQNAPAMEYCQIFGPEKIPDNLPEFLGYYLIRKIRCGKHNSRLAGIVVKKLGGWLAGKGYIRAEDGAEMARIGTEAARLLPEAHELTERLYVYASTHAPHNWINEIEDLFVINRIENGKLFLSGITTGGETICVPVPMEISMKLKKGWQVSLLLGQTTRGWHIIEVGDVYPL